jgi:hypothetical protein
VPDPNSQYVQWPRELDRACEDNNGCKVQSLDGCDNSAKQKAQYCVSKNVDIKMEGGDQSVCYALQNFCPPELINASYVALQSCRITASASI